MTHRSQLFPLFAVLTIAAFAFAIPVHASLGDNVSSVQSDAQHMRASVRVKQSGSYSVHEIQVGGATVREYSSPNGKVFGVAWQGPARPDLKQLLGSYYSRVEQAVAADKQQHPGRHPISIQLPNLVVHMGGHQRAFYGRAYVPDMIPNAVRAAEIR